MRTDFLTNFAVHREACGDDTEAQHELVKLIVTRVYVEATTLQSDLPHCFKA